MIRVQKEDFDIGVEIKKLTQTRTDIGAVVSFSGLARDHAGGENVSCIELEHYPGMTERELSRIEAEATTRWQLQASLIIHRVGKLKPGDNIVLVLTASAHRAAAFEAAEFLMDYLKTSAPLWKRETKGDGPHWVEARSSDDDAADRWKK